jgi:NAD(P)-dependent dehydrogenase (short-subunit alcohol dehydrogenase family)
MALPGAPFSELRGRCAVVTGAAQGIGRTTAETLARHGMLVLVADLNAERGERVVAGIVAAGGAAAFCKADVGTRAGCECMIQAAVSRFGGIYALVNNARVGMGHANGPLADVSEEEWDESQDVLLKSHFLACKLAIPHMIAGGGGGSIVGMSSLHAVQTNNAEGSYAAAKAGVTGLMRSVAIAYGKHGIRANSILPGGIMTDVKRESSGAAELGYNGPADPAALANPVRRRGEAQDIANAVLFLVSDLAGFVSGATLTVDGGMGIELPGSVASRL